MGPRVGDTKGTGGRGRELGCEAKSVGHDQFEGAGRDGSKCGSISPTLVGVPDHPPYPTPLEGWGMGERWVPTNLMVPDAMGASVGP